MTTAEILAAARAKKAGGAGATPAPAEAKPPAEAEPAAKLEPKKMTTAEILAAAEPKKPAVPVPLQHSPRRRLRLRLSRLRSSNRKR